MTAAKPFSQAVASMTAQSTTLAYIWATAQSKSKAELEATLPVMQTEYNSSVLEQGIVIQFAIAATKYTLYKEDTVLSGWTQSRMVEIAKRFDGVTPPKEPQAIV